MKKLSAVFLAVILVFSFPLTAYAADGDDSGLLGGLVDGFLNGLKGLFIPDEDFFTAFNADITAAIDRKTGGLATYFGSLTAEFNQLQNSGKSNDTLKITLPDNLLYKGYKGTSANLLGGIDSFAVWFRGLFSAFMVIGTVVICYRKVIALFKG